MCISQSEEVHSQCTFDTPENYGFICDEAKFLCGYELETYSGSLITSTGSTPFPSALKLCGTQGDPDNTQWLSFIAESSNLNIQVSFNNCANGSTSDGLQVGLYNSCELDSDTLSLGAIFCNQLEATSGTIDIIPDASLIQAGQLYYIYIDGYAQSVCDFSFDIISGVCTQPPLPIEQCEQDCGVTNSFGDNLGCTGIVETYSFQPSSQIIDNILGCNPLENIADLDSVICIDWMITPNVGFNLASTSLYYDSLDIVSSISVEWLAAGVYTIKPIITVNPLFAICGGTCECSDDIAYTVTINESTAVILPEIELCPGDCVDFCGTTICDSGSITCFDRANCEITTQSVVASQISFIDLGEFFICDTECFIFNGVSYCTPNLFSIPHPIACDSSYVFELVDLDIDLSLDQSDNLIDCDNTEAVMIASYTTNYTGLFKEYWTNETGDTVSFTNEYIATNAGTYTFHIVPIGLEGCSTTIENIVIQDDDTPEVNLTAPIINCSNTDDVISLSSTDAIASVSWTGPNGYISSDLSPSISEEGTYTAEILGANGCMATEFLDVVADIDPPVIGIISEDIRCTEDIPLAQYTSNDDIDFVEWWFGSQVVGDEDVLVLEHVGTYTLTVTGTNGCTAQETFEVTDLTYDPSLNIGEELIWRCNSDQFEIEIQSSTLDPDLTYIWNSLEGSFITNVTGGGSLTIDAPGVYILTSSDPNIGCVGKDTIRVLEDPNPLVDIDYEVIDPECFGGEEGNVLISGYVGGEGPFVFIHDDILYSNFEDIIFPIGNNELIVRDLYECEIIKSFEVKQANQIIITTEPNVTVKFGLPAQLYATSNLPYDQLESIKWTDGDDNLLAEGEEVSIDISSDLLEDVWVTITDNNKCTTTAHVRLLIDYEVDMYYPNVFSPNGDGQNDEFMIFSNGLTTMDLLQIFDRAGELIYTKEKVAFNETNIGWDGKFNGTYVQPGVYVFLVQYTLTNGQQKSKVGSITIIK